MKHLKTNVCLYHHGNLCFIGLLAKIRQNFVFFIMKTLVKCHIRGKYLKKTNEYKAVTCLCFCLNILFKRCLKRIKLRFR